ncbi:alpha/beta fold hydrolase [Actinophytocola glycyrrhizae]|uniref:Alpha/beta fold hydrolase n=1 Tax=Actinophytocola glycyrrhizae TaxID=2044873 RepID=A0ABV9S3H9_9PSEU
MKETDLRVAGGRTLHTYDTGQGDLVVFWHHGTPNTGLPPEPLFEPGLRWVSYDRPRYGGSSARPGRDIASAAEDAEVVADALGVDTFALLGHSGGGPHALACAALLPGRVRAVAAISCLAPFGAAGLDWFAGMGPNSAATLRAAATGRAAREQVEPGDPDFTPADWAALAGTWSWFGEVVGPALAGDRHAPVDDDLAYAGPWGFGPAAITAKTLLMHGRDDIMVPAAHSEWLARHIPGAELRLVPGEGHISVLDHARQALAWLRLSSG